MSPGSLETPKSTRLSTTMIPGLSKLRVGRLLGKVIAAYASAVSTAYGAAMGLSENFSQRNDSPPDRNY